MLVLTRERDQSIMLDDDVEITVVEIRGNKVRIGLSAPDSVIIHRKEIWLKIKQNEQPSPLESFMPAKKGHP